MHERSLFGREMQLKRGGCDLLEAVFKALWHPTFGMAIQ